MKRYVFLVFLLFLLFCMVGCVPSHLPSVISVSPLTGVLGQTLDVTITGTNFSGTERVVFEYHYGIRVNYFEVISPTKIRANISIYGDAYQGERYIIVTNEYGTGRGDKLFTVIGAPSISLISPARGTQGSLMDVRICGDGFYYGSTTCSFGRPDIEVKDYLQYLGPGGLRDITVTIRISSTATPGRRNVTVTNPYGTTTGTGMFTVTALTTLGPVVSSVTPDGICIGHISEPPSEEDVSIKGNNFTGTPTVSFGPDTEVNDIRLIDSHEIIVHIIVSPEAEFGYRDVKVTIGGVTGVGEDMFRVYTLI